MIRKYVTILCGAFILLAITIAGADNVVPCPDCKKSVSPRALFCPSCGCPGEIIAAEAAAEKPAKNAAPDRLLRVVADERRGLALPVQMADGLYALAPLDLLLATESLTLTFCSTNAPIIYAMPQVASDLPLVRFPITETNLSFWCVAPPDAKPTATLDYTTAFGPSYGVETTARTIASLSAATNLISLIDSVSGKRTAHAIGDAQNWAPIQPKLFREQSRVFEKLMRGENATVPDTWCHPIFEALLKHKQAQEK